MRAWRTRAFVFGICLSLVANVCSAPMLSPLQVTVAACPPMVLLLAVELLNGALKRRAGGETGSETSSEHRAEGESGLGDERVGESAGVVSLVSVSNAEGEGTAEERMWAHFVREVADGRTPNGAELDRVAGTHNYGRRVLRRWRAANKVPGAPRTEVTVAHAD